MDLRESDILSGDISNHWYYRSKLDAVIKLLEGINPIKILDVGAGSGFFSRELLIKTSAEQATCIDTGYEKEWSEECCGKEIVFRNYTDSSGADLLLLMDVLEHVEDDAGLLREYLDKISDGGYVLITVPAFQFLWSGHDDFLGHKRRYCLEEVRQLIVGMELEIVEDGYMFSLLFPLAFIIRLWDKVTGKKIKTALKTHCWLINSLLYFICRVELLSYFPSRLFGLTCFALGRKRITH